LFRIMMPQALRLTPELVARLPAQVPDPGPLARAEVPDSHYAATLAAINARLPEDGQLWVFAFGSILWKRRFEVVEERPAGIRGWHRKFCLGPDTRYRGNPAAPGVMLSLDRGGQCRGRVLRMAPEGRDAALEHLLRHEPPLPPAWVRAATPQGEVRAIAFVTRQDFFGYCGKLCDSEVADRLARAVGMWGSMAEYLCNTQRHLEAMGIRDRYLGRIEAMVAERLAGLPARQGSAAG
jgi:glutathione-specific gamma-glutamylcyclotransferase